MSTNRKFPEVVIQNIGSFSNSLDLKDFFNLREVSHNFYGLLNSSAWDRKNLQFSPWKSFPKTKLVINNDNQNSLQEARRKLNLLMATPQIFRKYDANGSDKDSTLGYLLDDAKFDHENFKELNHKLAPYIRELELNLVQILDADPFLETFQFDQFKKLQKLEVYFNIPFYEEKKKLRTMRNECKLLKRLLKAYEGTELEFISVDFTSSPEPFPEYKKILEAELKSEMFDQFPNVNFVFGDVPSLKLLKTIIPEDKSQIKPNFTIDFEGIAFEFNVQENLDSLRYMAPLVVNMDIRNEIFDHGQNPHFDLNLFNWTNLEKLRLSDWGNSLLCLRNFPKLRILVLDEPIFDQSILFADPNQTPAENFKNVFDKLPSIEEIEITTHARRESFELITDEMINNLKGMYKSVKFNIETYPPMGRIEIISDSEME